jgi:hypothetical protein
MIRKFWMCRPGFQELPFITLEDQFTGRIRLTYTNEPGRGPQLHFPNRPMWANEEAGHKAYTTSAGMDVAAEPGGGYGKDA